MIGDVYNSNQCAFITAMALKVVNDFIALMKSKLT
jgi:hypothetical protein